MDALEALLGRNGLLPHGVCYSWSPTLLWGMVVTDLLTAASYFSIPLVIARFVRRRGEMHNAWMAWLFGAFIFACGLTHVFDVVTIWQPIYGLQLATKALTAGVSLACAVLLWPLLPKALAIPSVHQLQNLVRSLEAEVQRRQSTEEQLLDTEQSLAATLASIGAGFVATDAQGRVTRMNPVAETLTGWRQAEALGLPLAQVVSVEGLSPDLQRRNPVDLLLESDPAASSTRQITLRSREGTLRPVQTHAQALQSGSGRVLGLALVLRDLSAEMQAHTEQQRLAAIVSGSSDAIIGKTLDGHITSWNRAAEELFGYRADEAIGRPIQLLIPPERESEEMRILTDLAAGRIVPPFDTVRLARDGRRLQVSITVSPIRDGSGRIVGASKIARDVTRQRQLEASERDSQERLRFALDAAQIGDWEIDVESGRLKHSVRFDRCFGQDTLPAHWGFADWLDCVHPDDRAELAQGLHAALSDGHDWHAEFRVSWPDGSTHWLSATGGLLRATGDGLRADGAPRCLVGILADLTPYKLAEAARLRAQQLEAENRQIQEANRLKSQFLANMSHELRTPLNAVIGFADLLRAGVVPEGSPKREEFLGHIGASGRHLLQLINDVLDLSKVEAGKLEFSPEHVDLERLVGEVCGVLQATLHRKRLALVVQIAPEVNALMLDPARLKQALYNYLSNAIKFTPEGGRIALKALPEGDNEVRIEVHDTGVGIAAADLSRLFVEFQQLDAGFDKRHGGTGLGLALTKRLVQAQGGRVGVRSVPGEGSVFHLVLPRTVRLTGDGPESRLLLVVNDLPWRTRLAGALSREGLQVDEAGTAGEALVQARRRAYQAIAFDLQLPDRDGLAMLADIRRDGASRDTPVVALSVVAQGNEAAAFGVTDLLSKPLRTQEVAAALTRLAVFHRSGTRTGLRVMVVDDDPLARDLMQATLGGLGIDTLCCVGGREALARLPGEPVDAMILDLMMPGFDGLATLEALRATPAGRQLPVYIWTSLLLTDEERALLARSAQGVTHKGDPSLATLLDTLRRQRLLPSATDTAS